MNAVFLDRDGVINENRPDHVKSWAEFRFIPGATEAVARLSELGVRVFITTNQAVINRGIITQSTVDDINRLMVAALERHGARIEAVAYCPHRPEDGCLCRKPKPGLLLDLADRYGLDLGETAVVGDALSDIEAGQAAGCRTVLVLTGRGREQLAMAVKAGKGGFTVASDLSAAVPLLVQRVAAVPHSWLSDTEEIAAERPLADYRVDPASLVSAPRER